jgi:hypothetical protein
VPTDALVLGRVEIVGDDVPLDALPPPDEASVTAGEETVEWVVAVGTVTTGDPEVVGPTSVGVGRSGTIAVAAAGDPVATGRGAVAVVGVAPGLVAAEAAGFADFAFEAEALWAAFGQRPAFRAERALPCGVFPHVVDRRACVATFAGA